MNARLHGPSREQPGWLRPLHHDRRSVRDHAAFRVRSRMNGAAVVNRIHISSLVITCNPCSPKNSPMPMGDAATGMYREEVSGCIKRGEKRDAQASIGQRVKDAMRYSRQEQVQTHSCHHGPGLPSITEGDQKPAQERGKGERMRQPAVPPQISILDAITESNDIDIRQDRAQDAQP